MRTIWKYEINLATSFLVTDKLVRIVHLSPLNATDHMSVWCEVDADDRKPKQTSEIVIVGTGMPIPVGFMHIKTVVMPSKLVWHLYMKPADVPFQEHAIKGNF